MATNNLDKQGLTTLWNKITSYINGRLAGVATTFDYDVVADAEVPPIAIEQGGTGAVTAEGALANLGLGAVADIKILWENSSLSSVFLEQTITMNGTADFYIFIFNLSTRDMISNVSELAQTQGTAHVLAAASTESINHYSRFFSISGTKVTFGGAFRKAVDATTTGTAVDDYMIPKVIYGIDVRK